MQRPLTIEERLEALHSLCNFVENGSRWKRVYAMPFEKRQAEARKVGRPRQGLAPWLSPLKPEGNSGLLTGGGF
jgi:hypothetical protein